MGNYSLPTDTFTVAQVANGIECRWRKFKVKLYSIILAITLVISALLGVIIGGVSSWQSGLEVIYFAIVFFVVFGSLALGHYIAYRNVLRCIGRYPIYKVKFDNPRLGFVTNRCSSAAYFKVTVHTEDGDVEIDTRQMFTRAIIEALPFENYVNKEAYVFYDEDRLQVYVIDLVENLPL